MTLKVTRCRKAAKNLSDFTKFPTNMFLFSARKNICTAALLDAEELPSWSTLKAYVFIYLCTSLRGDWIISLRQLTVWISQHFDTSIYSIKTLKFFQTIRTSMVRLVKFLKFTISQYKIIWQENMGAIRKVRHLHNGIFHPLPHFVNFALSPPLCYLLNVTEKL